MSRDEPQGGLTPASPTTITAPDSDDIEAPTVLQPAYDNSRILKETQAELHQALATLEEYKNNNITQ